MMIVDCRTKPTRQLFVEQSKLDNRVSVPYRFPITIPAIGRAQAFASLLVDGDALGVAPVTIGIWPVKPDLNVVSHLAQRVQRIG
jgi:hypothetical protein